MNRSDSLSALPVRDLDSVLNAWVEHRWLRPLDRALVHFLRDLVPDCDPWTLLSAALVSHQLGRGHICMVLEDVLQDPDGLLALPPENRQADPSVPRPSQLLRALDVQHWMETLANSPVVDTPAAIPSVRADGVRPLVLEQGRLYLRRYWRYEQQVARHLRQRLTQPAHPTPQLREHLDNLFSALRDADELAGQSIHWQTVAAALAARHGFTVISGGPGTGKTTTVVRLLGVLQMQALSRGAQPLLIRLAAPTGKAAARLTESIGSALKTLPDAVQQQVPAQVTTLHRLLGPLPDSRQFRHHAGNPLSLDVLVVDEASMVDLEMMAQVLDALPAQARLILLGDKDQLASVEAGAVLGELCALADQPGYTAANTTWLRANTGYDLDAWQGGASALGDHIALLRKSHRFGPHSGIGRLALAVNTADQDALQGLWDAGLNDIGRLDLGQHPEALDRLIQHGQAGQFPPTEHIVGYAHYLQVLRQHRPAPGDRAAVSRWASDVLQAFGRFRLLAAVRQGDWGVEGLNLRAQRGLIQAGLLPTPSGQWYEGRPVLVTRNDYSLNLMNGDIGIALHDPADNNRLRVFFADTNGAVRTVLPSRLSDVETVFAMTVHKAQGSEFEHTALVLPERLNPVLTRELVYTGITRARQYFTLAGPLPALLMQAVQRQIRRASGLGWRLNAKPEPSA